MIFELRYRIKKWENRLKLVQEEIDEYHGYDKYVKNEPVFKLKFHADLRRKNNITSTIGTLKQKIKDEYSKLIFNSVILVGGVITTVKGILELLK